jgi:hypothetical protein
VCATAAGVVAAAAVVVAEAGGLHEPDEDRARVWDPSGTAEWGSSQNPVIFSSAEGYSSEVSRTSTVFSATL